MTAESIRIAIVAGETSGDLLAGHLIQALQAKLPNAVFFGIGGGKMIAQGFQTWYPLEKLAVRGYVEVLRHYREISAIKWSGLTGFVKWKSMPASRQRCRSCSVA